MILQKLIRIMLPRKLQIGKPLPTDTIARVYRLFTNQWMLFQILQQLLQKF